MVYKTLRQKLIIKQHEPQEVIKHQRNPTEQVNGQSGGTGNTGYKSQNKDKATAQH